MNYTYKSPYKDTNSRVCVQMLYVMHDFHPLIHSFGFSPTDSSISREPDQHNNLSYSDVVLSLINSQIKYFFKFAFVDYKDVPGQSPFRSGFHLLAVALILKPTRCHEN